MNNLLYIRTIWKTNRPSMDAAAKKAGVHVQYHAHTDSDFWAVYVPLNTPKENLDKLEVEYNSLAIRKTS